MTKRAPNKDGHQGADLELRLSVTGQCQLRCGYCRPDGREATCAGPAPFSFDEVLTVVRALKRRFSLRKVRITGGEPLLRPDLPRLVEMLAAQNIPDLAMTTNGQCLAHASRALKRAGLGRVNISLDSLEPDTFRALTGGRLGRTLAGIDAALEHGLNPVKLNCVALRPHTPREAAGMLRFAMRKGCRLRFLELMPFGPGAGPFGASFVPTAEMKTRLSEEFSLEPLPHRPGATSRDFRVTDGDGHTGTVGFISPCSKPFCDGCTRLRLTSTGRLIGCLRSPEGPSLREVLDGPGDIEEAIFELVSSTLCAKAGRQGFPAQRSMVNVGG